MAHPQRGRVTPKHPPRMNFSTPPLRSACVTTVIVPVHNEEKFLPGCLESLYQQTVSHDLYDVILLLNNCTDQSVRVAEQFQRAHPDFALYSQVVKLAPHQANVGTARKLLMDHASRRLPSSGAILSTDGDTQVAPDWVETNLAELSQGADLVGGEIALNPVERRQLNERALRRYDDDAEYQTACTRLETLLDPDPCDPWPRHHHHFGASLACSNELYRRLGGLPCVESLEDVAFVNLATRHDARVRHSPAVRVWTTARTSGRAKVGLASQLREWEISKEERVVDSAAFLKRYFDCRLQLRMAWATKARKSGGRGFAARNFPAGITLQHLRRKHLRRIT